MKNNKKQNKKQNETHSGAKTKMRLKKTCSETRNKTIRQQEDEGAAQQYIQIKSHHPYALSLPNEMYILAIHRLPRHFAALEDARGNSYYGIV